ncbi:SpaA isopeptide-forming pilin-related protein [Blautia marasmi]|uniref:SpaA isopeptide-forming pilin-related protein n=1 Tax=Blautia marasmi TaxID=1917868 RepID=UPI00131A1C3C|nr:SpaA isopeptide-forming pilin-related protein [Blautia marasmi]
MSKIKKVLAMLLALAMVLGTTLTTFAAESTDGNAEIKINNAEGARFGTVQVIEDDASTDTGWAFVDGYAQYFTQANAFNTNNEQEIIKGMIYAQNPGAKEAEEIAGFAHKYAAALQNVFGTIKDETATDTNPIPVENAGVYVIRGFEGEGVTYSPMAAYVGFDYDSGKPSGILNAEEINAKKSTTHVEKENNDEDKVVEINKPVTYKVNSIVPFVPETDTNKYYRIIDEIKGAAYELKDNTLDVNVVIKETKDAEQSKYTHTYQVVPTTTTDNNQTFELNLDELLVGNPYANMYIELTYTAIVKDMIVNNTVYAGKGENEGKDVYGSNNDKLVSGTVTLTKKDANDDTIVLAGAEFVLTKVVGNVVNYAIVDETTKKLTGWTTVEEDATTLVTKDDGTVTVNGLEKGVEYKFKEIKAPDGYSINETDATVTWGDVPAELDKPVEGISKMLDTKLSSLPGTGGIGTTIFTIGGCLIMIVAAGLFFASRRKSAK